MMEKISIDSGSRFGILTVVEEVEQLRGYHRIFKCLCDCGVEKNVRMSSLRSGHAKSCGCSERSIRIKVHIGEKFGRWTVMSDADMINGRSYVVCKCECGKVKSVNLSSLKRGCSTGCGCGRKESAKSHGMTSFLEYRTWCGIKERCSNSNLNAYSEYGGRGITVCDRWVDSFENFYEDMGPKPGKGYSIDRIDNDGNYEPGNCRWATRKQQNMNKRNTVILTVDGVPKTMKEWSELAMIPYYTIKTRVRRGWNHKEAVYGRTNEQL